MCTRCIGATKCYSNDLYVVIILLSESPCLIIFILLFELPSPQNERYVTIFSFSTYYHFLISARIIISSCQSFYSTHKLQKHFHLSELLHLFCQTKFLINSFRCWASHRHATDCTFLSSDGDVRVNWATVTKNNTTVRTGDIISVSGKGRAKVSCLFYDMILQHLHSIISIFHVPKHVWFT